MNALSSDESNGLRSSLFLCESGWEAALADELRRTLPTANICQAGSGYVAVDGDVTNGEPTVAFSRQCLPRVVRCEAESIARWSAAACGEITSQLDSVEVPWRLHVFGLPQPDGASLARRAALIAARIDADLRDGRRRLAKRRILAAEGPWLDDEALVQVVLESPTTGYLSVCRADERHRLRRVVSRFVGGYVEPAVDKNAPSRAFAKLLEAERRLNRPIAAGETCVDLGAAPGSWTYTALHRGATVTAVDRTALRDDLMRHPRATFVQGDAFRYQPEQPVDWLLSDVIAFPDRVAELLERWLGQCWCRRFIVTIKFRGREEDAALETIKAFVAAGDYEFCVRRFDANKNEATAYGVRRDVELPHGWA